MLYHGMILHWYSSDAHEDSRRAAAIKMIWFAVGILCLLSQLSIDAQETENWMQMVWVNLMYIPPCICGYRPVV